MGAAARAREGVQAAAEAEAYEKKKVNREPVL